MRVACALLAAAVLLLHTGTSAQTAAPEALHRRAYFKLDTRRFAQAMWLEGAMHHRLPTKFPCSSLEGASCLYESLPESGMKSGGSSETLALSAIHRRFSHV